MQDLDTFVADVARMGMWYSQSPQNKKGLEAIQNTITRGWVSRFEWKLCHNFIDGAHALTPEALKEPACQSLNLHDKADAKKWILPRLWEKLQAAVA